MNHFWPAKDLEFEEIAFTMKGWQYKFLMGLNFEYENMSQILKQQKVCDLEQAITIAKLHSADC